MLAIEAQEQEFLSDHRAVKDEELSGLHDDVAVALAWEHVHSALLLLERVGGQSRLELEPGIAVDHEAELNHPTEEETAQHCSKRWRRS